VIGLLEKLIQYVLPFFLGGVVMGLLSLSGGDYPLWGLHWSVSLAAVVLLLGVLVYDLHAAFRSREAGVRSSLREFRLLFVTSSLVMLGADFASTTGIMFYPLVFLLMLYAGTFSSTTSLASVVLYVIALRWITAGGPVTASAVIECLTFSVLVVVFGVFGIFFLKAEVVRLRASSRRAIEQYFQGIVDMARSFRFISMPSARLQGVKEDNKVKILSIQSALEETRTTVYTMLETLRQGCGLYTCVVLWLDAGSTSLRVIEASTASENISRGEIPPLYGLTGAAVNHGRPLSVCPVDLRTKVIPYYEKVEEIRSICVVPVIEGKDVRGVLCADRLTEDPFTPEEEQLFERVSEQIVRVVRTERTIITMARSRHEQSKLYRAASRLKDAVREDQVVEVLFDSARDIMKWDFAAFTTFDRGRRSHCIAFAEGRGAEDLRGLVFTSNEGLVSQTVKIGHALPWKGEYDPQNQIIFTKRVKFKDMRSLYVIPVIAGEKALGTVVLAARRPGAFSAEKNRLLQVIVDQSAVAYQNARNMQALERMATTDSLTGLFNRRVFMEALGRKFQSARRFGRELSVVITDLDRFKSVNDTYGHHVGDEVLKMFAEVLRESARSVDLVARWGGEEFVVLCEETGRDAACQVAERIRSGMQARLLQVNEETTLQVTCSLGVATYPLDADSPHGLVERADAFLYTAKNQGRNRVVSAQRETIQEAV
jgi:two-component system cell cycle response regulator